MNPITKPSTSGVIPQAVSDTYLVQHVVTPAASSRFCPCGRLVITS